MIGHGQQLSTIPRQEFEKVGASRVSDGDRIAIVADHFTPSKDIRTAELIRTIREWTEKYGVKNFFDVGARGGIEHIVLPENGLVRPGSVIVGGDSHTTTYGAFGCFSTGVGSTDLAAAFITGRIWLRVPETIKFRFNGRPGPWTSAKDMILVAIHKVGVDGGRYRAVALAGSAVADMDIAGRSTMANMSTEMGAKSSFCEVDEKTAPGRVGVNGYTAYADDRNAEYSSVVDIDVDGMGPWWRPRLAGQPEATSGSAAFAWTRWSWHLYQRPSRPARGGADPERREPHAGAHIGFHAGHRQAVKGLWRYSRTPGPWFPRPPAVRALAPHGRAGLGRNLRNTTNRNFRDAWDTWPARFTLGARGGDRRRGGK